MIKLDPNNGPKPAQLTDDVVKTLTDKFKADKNARVWNKSYIKEALLKLSHRKCCYAECYLGEESKYMEVEHFYPKGLYPDEVVKWENLLPSSKSCNTTKGDWNTKKDPIINPLVDHPKDHLYFKGYRFYAKTTKGENTLEAVGLNDRKQWVMRRAKIGLEVIEKLENLKDKLQETPYASLTTRRQGNVRRTLKNLMEEGIPQAEYSATVATVLLNEAAFKEIKAIFEKEGIWNADFVDLENQVAACAMSEHL